MMLTLANLLRDNPALREIAERWGDKGAGSPSVFVLPLGVAVMIATAYYVWRWQTRLLREPNSRALLKLLAGRLGLNRAHRKLLWQLGRAAGLEPAMSLVSPELLTHLVHSGEQAGIHLTGRQTLEVGRILDAVASAANDGRQ